MRYESYGKAIGPPARRCRSVGKTLRICVPRALDDGKMLAKCVPSVRWWQDRALMRSWATGSGNILARCVPECLAVAKCSRNASPGGNPWQVLRSMYPESGLGRENRQFVAAYRRRVSKMSLFWQDMRAMHPKSPANSRLGIHRAKILP